MKQKKCENDERQHSDNVNTSLEYKYDGQTYIVVKQHIKNKLVERDIVGHGSL